MEQASKDNSVDIHQICDGGTEAGERLDSAKSSNLTQKSEVRQNLAASHGSIADEAGGTPALPGAFDAHEDTCEAANTNTPVSPSERAALAGGIEILVKLAETGEIDPKNVDIIDVTDKFLKAIAAAPKENLRQSGKILFHASVLLRMKAEALLAQAGADLDPGDDFLDFDEDGAAIIYDSRRQAVARQITLQDLERALVRKANNRQNRHRRVTLEQLIAALREAERIEKTRADRQPRARIELAGQHEVNDVSDILDLAHDEDIESTIDRVEEILSDVLNEGEVMQLIRLIQLLGGRGDWVDAFLAVLFLSNAGKITIEQSEFYGPLYLMKDEQKAQATQVAV